MNLENARRLLSEIPEQARVIDVGGGAAPFPRADYIIDALPFDAAGTGSHGNIDRQLACGELAESAVTPRYNRDRWVQLDLCDRRPWPFADKSFDFAICSHLLEDLRDPIWVCSEMQRIAKAGYIEIPSRVEEQSKGVENPRHAGYFHHRWLITREGNGLRFRHKPHMLHGVNDAIVTHLAPGWCINPHHAIVSLDWKETFEARELLEFNEDDIISELCAFAADARRLPNLRQRVPMPLFNRFKRHVLYFRMSRGRR